MKIRWFAWFRTRVGVGEEMLSPPPEVTNVGELIAWLKTRSPGHAEALKELSVVRVAVNQEYVRLDHPVRASDEVALFPPVTGG
jgi:molybdopterin synthase sulfur carrier subunit